MLLFGPFLQPGKALAQQRVFGQRFIRLLRGKRGSHFQNVGPAVGPAQKMLEIRGKELKLMLVWLVAAPQRLGPTWLDLSIRRYSA